MAAKHKARAAYRDKVTGRFVSRAVWKRSKARGGKRYKRVRVHVPGRQRAARPKAPLEEKEGFTEREDLVEEKEDFEEIEFQGAFDSPGGKKK